jgi:hypothetical protein
MTILEDEPTVRVGVDVKYEKIHMNATMQGKPTRVKGAVVYVEVLTETGRHTLVPVENVEPLNETAKAMLAAEPAKKPEA